MAKAQQPERPSFFQGLKQIPLIVRETAKADKKFVPLVLPAVLVPLAVGGLLFGLGLGFVWLIAGITLALLGFMLVLSRRAGAAQMNVLQGQPGAAAYLVENMRGDWRVHQAVASTTDFDMVHAVVCRAGVVLLAEVGKSGNPNRVRSLLGQEKRRLSKIIGGTDLREFIVGDEENQLPLKKVRTTLMKLPRTISGKEVNALDSRLTAITARPQMPKGAIPKNMRPQKGAFRASRGR
jgi:hypothetical protein